MKVKYLADDGTEFASEQACRKYEASNTIEARIVGPLTGGGPKAIAFLEAAIRYDANVDGAIDLANALEQAARRCALARIAQGGAKRKRKGKEKTNGAPNMGEKEPEECTPTGGSGAVTSFPSPNNPFPAHARDLAAGQVSSEGYDGPTAAE